MAATKAPYFALAERQILGLYDAGVLSPAVLQHVLAAYASVPVDWREASGARSVDGHSIAEVVVLTMMPGRALRTAKKDYLAVIEHVVGERPAASEEEPPAEDDEALLSQLSGAATPSRGNPPRRSARVPARGKASEAAADTPPRKATGFNPLVHATGLRGKPDR